MAKKENLPPANLSLNLILKLSIEKGADVNAKDKNKNKNTLLHYPPLKVTPTYVKYLTNRGANLEDGKR